MENEPHESRPRTSVTGEKWLRQCTHLGEQDFFTEHCTTNAEYYSALLEVPVKATIRNKRKRAPISASFLQDNACGRSHHGHHPETEMERLPHPPYSPDLAPSDYHLFGRLKEHLDGKKFRKNEEVIRDVQEWLHWQPKDFFLSGICKLPDRWRKCIANQGDYVEKQRFQSRRINQCFCSIYEL